MTACGGLKHIFDKPFSDQSYTIPSWNNQINSSNSKTIDQDSSFTDIFGELSEPPFSSSISSSSSTNFSSSLPPLSASCSSSTTSSSYYSSFFLDSIQQSGINEELYKEKISNEGYYKDPVYPTSNHKKHYSHSDSFSSWNSDSLSTCTEGLGFESSDDIEDMIVNDKQLVERTPSPRLENHESKKSRTNKGGSLPPPISCIGRNGKPCVSFKSLRQDGRFILKEIRIPTQERLHACREDGRLKLQMMQSDDDDILEEDDEEEYYDDEEEYTEDVEEEASSNN